MLLNITEKEDKLITSWRVRRSDCCRYKQKTEAVKKVKL